MPLISCDPDDPNGGRFSVIGRNGRCEVLVDREGRPNLVYTANNDNQTAQVEVLMTQMTLNRNVITVVVSDSEDEDEGAPKTPKRSRPTNFTVEAGAQRTPASPTAPRTQPRNAQLSIPSPPGTPATPRNTPVLRTPDLSPTKTSTTISSPSSLAETLSPLIFAAPSLPPSPSPPIITCHPTAPSYTGNGIFNPTDYAVPRRWALRYAAPWSPVPKCGPKWYVVCIGFEVGVFWDTWNNVQPLVCLPNAKFGYGQARYSTHLDYSSAIAAWSKGPIRRQNYPFPR